MAGPVDNAFLIQATTYLGATAIAVPLFKKFKLGTILGFLAAGIALGDHGLGLLHAEEGVFQIAELGVVLFLFIIGLEVSLGRLWDLRKDIFGLGLLQWCLTGLLFVFCLLQFSPLSAPAAWIAGFALAGSSTAFALSILEERNELNSTYGNKSFSILLFQDLAVIPLLAAIPFLAPVASEAAGGIDVVAIGKAAATVIILILIARFVLNRVFGLVAVSGSREAFAALALFVVAGTALAVSAVGLSMALGAFVAGVMLAESSFRHQIEADIRPFRELLLGLFFIGVGMQLDLNVIAENWLIVICGTFMMLSVKSTIIYFLARMFRTGHEDALKVGAVLSQSGEFAFVVFSLGAAQSLFGVAEATLMSAIVTLSMMLTPIMMIFVGFLPQRKSAPHGLEELVEIEEGSVLIVGFGRMGQIISQVLHSSGIKLTTIDNNPYRIEQARKFGSKIYFGDGFDVGLLQTAGVAKVDAVIFALNDNGHMRKAIKGLQVVCPNLKIIVRAHDRLHEMKLMDAGIDHIVRETLESSLEIAGATLNELGKSESFIDDVKAEFRLRDKERLLEQKAGDMYAGKDKMAKPFAAARSDQ